MLTFVLSLIAIVIVIIFWRVFLPLAGFVVFVGCIFAGYLYIEDMKADKKREKEKAIAQAELNKAKIY